MNNNQKVTLGCYFSSLSMSVSANLPPILFLTFRSLYGISYSLLGFLIAVNFITQLAIDLIFSFFSHKFNIPKVVKAMPILTVTGLLIYAMSPLLFRGCEYIGLLAGTVVFSASSGLAEVLISPVIATIPSKNPDKQMSALHSVYAWGVVFVVIFSTLYLYFFGEKNWQYLVLILCTLPIISAIFLALSHIPHMDTPANSLGALKFLKQGGVWICVLAIFLGGAAECSMSQWASPYLEKAFAIPKVYGDIFGMALFALFLGLGRSLYAKYGKNLPKVLVLSTIGATICYFVSAVSPVPFIGLCACALTGLFTAMLWPGNLVLATERFPESGVLFYALMAAGGDLGASVAPQLIGIVTDKIIAKAYFSEKFVQMGISAEQLGMKCGMLSAMLFPLIAVFLYIYMLKKAK